MFFEKEVKCTLCPNFCVLKNGQIGQCLRRIEKDGDIVPIGSGKFTHIAVDPIEKKPFKHFLSGSQTLSLGGWGCSLRCNFCENHLVSQTNLEKQSKEVSCYDVINMALDNKCSSICFTYNEPTINIEYLIGLSNSIKEREEYIKNYNDGQNLKLLLKTNAYVNKSPWKEICKCFDAINIDFKGSYEQYRDICGAKEYVVEDRIKEAYDYGKHIEISIPIYPSFMDDIRAFFKISYSVGKLSSDIPCHLLKVYPCFLIGGKMPVSDKSLELPKYILEFYLKNVYIVS